jgi:hypothetical protein
MRQLTKQNNLRWQLLLRVSNCMGDDLTLVYNRMQSLYHKLFYRNELDQTSKYKMVSNTL